MQRKVSLHLVAALGLKKNLKRRIDDDDGKELNKNKKKELNVIEKLFVLLLLPLR